MSRCLLYGQPTTKLLSSIFMWLEFRSWISLSPTPRVPQGPTPKPGTMYHMRICPAPLGPGAQNNKAIMQVTTLVELLGSRQAREGDKASAKLNFRSTYSVLCNTHN